MLTRRSLLFAGFAGWCLDAARAAGPVAASPLTVTPPAFDIPPNACDAHVHVIGEPWKFPMRPGRNSNPPPATAQALAEQLKLLRLERVVIVTPDAYGDDNGATVDAINRLGRSRARGVAWVAEDRPPEMLTRLRSLGIAGMRFAPPYKAGALNAAIAVERLSAKLAVARQLDWHVEMAAPPEVTAALKVPLAASPVPIVIDTFGWAQGGVTQSGFDAVLELIKRGPAYVKLSEPYRLSKQAPDYPDLTPLVHALVAANADRLLWGSGWPYLSGVSVGKNRNAISPPLPIDAGHLLNLFARWVPDAEVRHKILVDNPARLYRF